VTKYGLLRVFRMRVTPTAGPLAAGEAAGAELPPDPWAAVELDELEELELHAARAAVAQRAAAAYTTRRRDCRRAPWWGALVVELSMLFRPLRSRS
jgi:hypothetical protein